jgi:peptide/nickel transport system ATP-binding protein
LIDSQPSALRLRGGAPPRKPEAPTPLLEIDGLAVEYGRPGVLPWARRQTTRALNQVSFSVEPGEIFGVVGESGSGKSTIARAVTRLVAPTKGVIRYRGESIAELKGEGLSAFRRKVQMVFQNPFDSLNPRMTALDTIAEPLIRHRLADRRNALARAKALMEQVELSADLGGRRPHELSGGQCQRVGIARALALDPELLIPDEITSALDVTIQAQVLRLLQRLQAERDLTVLYISHDLGLVRLFCRRVAVFRGGRLIETGSVCDVLERPREEYTRMLIAAQPRLARAATGGAAPDGAEALHV